MVAADLLAQAEHGPSSPACLVTTSPRLAEARRGEIERQLAGLATARDRRRRLARLGSIYVADSAKTAVEIMDLLAPEHLEILAADPDFYLDRPAQLRLAVPGPVVDRGLRRQGHVRAPTTCCPPARGARYTGGLSVAGFLKQLTYQRATREATAAQAEPRSTIADFEEHAGHRDSAQLSTWT